MLLRRLKFKSLSYLFILICSVSLSVQATQNLYEIELNNTKKSHSFVRPNGNIYEKYREEFLSSVNAHGNITQWDTLKTVLSNDNQEMGIVGEVAAKIFFEENGYKILESHYKHHISLLEEKNPRNEDMKTTASCTSKKGPDNGIDGIFFKYEKNKGYKFIINEAKFRNKSKLSKNDFGFVKRGKTKIQQSHSFWNKYYFDKIDCLKNEGIQYDNSDIRRTATLLNTDGLLILYEITDKQ